MLKLMRKENDMRTTVTLDDELLKDAVEFTGIQEKSALVNKALKMLVEWEASRFLARMGGTAPGLKAPPRRRPPVTARRRRAKAA
jgi:Arc/MetJ family transcription regulator